MPEIGLGEIVSRLIPEARTQKRKKSFATQSTLNFNFVLLHKILN
jgi:hypothetical protein